MNYTESDLKNKKNSELAEICRAAKLPVSGTKAALIARILGRAPPVVRKKEQKTASKAPQNKEPCAALATALKNRSKLIVTKNEQGNFEHKETGFIFDATTKKVVGKQADDGAVVNITITDLEVCKEFGFLVDENKVDKEFAAGQTNRLEELEKYMKDYDTDDEEEDELDI